MVRIGPFVALATAFLVLAPGAQAQSLPPHTPGTICDTPRGWCWPTQSGTPGTACSCSVGGASVSGTYN